LRFMRTRHFILLVGSFFPPLWWGFLSSVKDYDGLLYMNVSKISFLSLITNIYIFFSPHTLGTGRGWVQDGVYSVPET